MNGNFLVGFVCVCVCASEVQKLFLKFKCIVYTYREASSLSYNETIQKNHERRRI
jgi:hypothetical protein